MASWLPWEAIANLLRTRLYRVGVAVVIPAWVGEKPPELHEGKGTPLWTEALTVFVGQEVRMA